MRRNHAEKIAKPMFGLDITADDIAAACSRPTVMRIGFGRAHVMRRNHAENIAKPMFGLDITADDIAAGWHPPLYGQWAFVGRM